MANLFGTDGASTIIGTAGADLIYGYDPNGAAANVTSISTTIVATGLNQALFAGAPAGDFGRLFIVERGGLIKVLDLESGQIAATPFLNLTGQVAAAGESGLLGLAFDPDFATNGYFYVDLVNTAGDTEVRRYQVSGGDPNLANAASATTIITIDQPAATNHKAGWIGFGPDGDLYIPTGDGGDSSTAQNIASLLGKVLRIDVHSDGFPGDATKNYAIPADNMFVGVAGADEIWALGLRNPFRDSFDHGTGQLFLADVGQNTWEEIDLGAAGANFGWSVYEGPDIYAGGTPSAGVLTAPIHYYGRTVGATVIGGYVYRGPSDGLQGFYFYADTSSGDVSTLHQNGPNWTSALRLSDVVGNPVSFGEDGAGALYVVGYDGSIARLTPAFTSADQNDVLGGGNGNDMMFGGGGDDYLDSGVGNDTVYGGAGADGAILGDGNDVAVLGDGNDYAYGGAGTDAVSGGEGVDILLGEAGDDDLYGDNGGDYIYSGTGNDVAFGGAGADVIIGEDGDDVLNGGAENDYLYGGAGNDLARGGAGADLFVMDVGDDFVDAGAGNDFVYGGDGADIIYGGAGTDVLLGEAGNDFISPQAGVDYVYLGTGADTLLMDKNSSGVAVLYDFTPGAADNDVLRLLNTGWTSIAQVQVATTNTGNGYSILTLDADTAIWLVGVTSAQLTAGDVLFT